MSLLGNIAGMVSRGVESGTLDKIMQIFGTVGEATGKIYEGISAEEQGKIAAASALRRSAYEAQLRRKEGKRLVGKQQVSYAKSGVEPTGTPLEVMSEAIREAEMDALMIEMRGGEEAGYYRRMGKGQRTAGIIGGTTLLTRAGGLLADKTIKPGSKSLLKNTMSRFRPSSLLNPSGFW